MEFDEMKVIWDSQSNQKLYAINEDALFDQIKRKGRSVARMLNFFDLMMFGMNFAVGILLVVNARGDNEPIYHYAPPVLYFAFSLFSFFRRRVRKQEEVRFDQTVVGELEKAIWQIDYLIAQGRSMILWYVSPLALVFSATMLLDGKLMWALIFPIFLIVFSYFGGQWELRKWHLPKKRSLESLREMMLATPG